MAAYFGRNNTLQSGISLLLKKGLKNFISRLAHQTDIAWTRFELDKIELGDVRTKYASKQVPKGRSKKLTTATVADGDYLLQEKREADGEERAEEERVKGIAARRQRERSLQVVVAGRVRVVVAGWGGEGGEGKLGDLPTLLVLTTV